MGSSYTAWNQLMELNIGYNSPVSDDYTKVVEYANPQIELVLGSLNSMVPPGATLTDRSTAPLWFAVRDLQKQVYFTAHIEFASTFLYALRLYGPDRNLSLGSMNFSAQLVPSVPSDQGYVFCPIFILPAYLQALGTFLQVGSVLHPQFVEVYRPEIVRHYKFLAEVHTKILTEGYVFLPMPENPCFPSPATPLHEWNFWEEGFAFKPDDLKFLDDLNRVPVDFVLVYTAHRSEFRRPFGCVDRFTGSYVIANYPAVQPQSTDSKDLLTVF